MTGLHIDDPDHPDNQFHTPAELIADYHYRLGLFVTDYAETEALLRLKCAIAAEIPADLAGIVFGDVAVAAGGQLLKRLRSAKGVEQDEDLTRALVQFGHITETRNAILHRGVEFDERSFATRPGLPNSRRQRYQVSPSILEDMTLDLVVIRAALIVAVPSGDPSFTIWADGVRNLARTPWRYTHAPLPRPTGHH